MLQLKLRVHLPSLTPIVDDCPIHLILKFLFFYPKEECFTFLPQSLSSYSSVWPAGWDLSSSLQSEPQEGRMQCPARSELLLSSVLSWRMIPARVIRWLLGGISWYCLFMRIHCKHTVFTSEITISRSGCLKVSDKQSLTKHEGVTKCNS